MKMKSLIAATIFTMAGMILPAHAGATWTVTASGIIDDGNDDTGVFGAAGRSLIGSTYTQSITISTNPADYDSHVQVPGYYNELFANVLKSTAVDNVTIDGVTRTFTTTANATATQLLDGFLSSGNPSVLQFDRLLAYIYDNGSGFAANNDLRSDSTPFLSNLNFDQGLTVITDGSFSGHGFFSLSTDQSAYFSGRVSRLVVNSGIPNAVKVTTVPEPGSLALFGLGVLAFIGSRRKLVKQSNN